MTNFGKRAAPTWLTAGYHNKKGHPSRGSPSIVDRGPQSETATSASLSAGARSHQRRASRSLSLATAGFGNETLSMHSKIAKNDSFSVLR